MVKNGDARRDAIWHDGGAYPPRRPEVSRACPRPMLPTRAAAGRVSAAPATRPAHGPGDVGTRRGPGGQRRQSAVLNALEPMGHPRHATRQRLREWTYDGADRAAPCGTDLEVAACFAPLLRWVLSWWSGETLPLAIDATSLGTRWVIIAVCVLYRGCAIPVAWHVTPGPGHGPWMAPIQTLLTQLAPAVPPTMTVLVLTDRGLWSPRLWRSITAIGWHPLMRIRPDPTFAPLGSHR